MNKSKNDWVKGELLKVTRKHFFSKGDPDGIWPNIFLRKETQNYQYTAEQVPIDTVVMALDDKPLYRQSAVVRVLYGGEIWVANSNYLSR